MGQKKPKTGETQSLPFGHFIKGLGEAVNWGQMALKQACTKFFLERTPGENYALSIGKLDRNERKGARRRAYPSAIL